MITFGVARDRLRSPELKDVLAGLSMLEYLDAPYPWQALSQGATIDADGRPGLLHTAAVCDLVVPPYRGLVALWALRKSGGLDHTARLDLSPLARVLFDINLLAGLEKLTELSLAGCEHLRTIRSLHTLPRLKWLDLSDCDGLTDLDEIGQLHGLTDLRLRGRAVTSVEAIRSLPHLNRLSVSSPTCEYLDVSSLTQLMDLDLGGWWSLKTIDGLNLLDLLARLVPPDGSDTKGRLQRPLTGLALRQFRASFQTLVFLVDQPAHEFTPALVGQDGVSSVTIEPSRPRRLAIHVDVPHRRRSDLNEILKAAGATVHSASSRHSLGT